MRFVKKTLRWTLIIVVSLLLLANLVILLSGRTYIYKGLANTYLKGRSGPAIDEFRIFANREVASGTADKWKTATRINAQPIPAEHASSFEQLGTVAYVVVRGDSIVHEQYWDGYGPESYSNSFSMAKTFVGLLIGAAIQDGYIKSPDQPVGDFIPEFNKGRKAKITIRHLLTMSSGIDFDENYVSPFAYPAAAYYGSDLRGLTLGYDVAEAPGETFRYLSGNSELLAFIIMKATGKNLSEYMSERIWKKVGAERPAYWSLDSEDGVEKAYCCFNSNARDFARLGTLALHHGKWKQAQVLDSAYLAASVAATGLKNPDGTPAINYGFAWWLMPGYKGENIFYARGILGQYIICIPGKKLVVVRLGHKREKEQRDGHPLDVYRYIDAALEMYGN